MIEWHLWACSAGLDYHHQLLPHIVPLTFDHNATYRPYHAWIITPTPDGTHLWTEETMQGPLWIELAKQAPDIFWRTHQRLLQDLAKVATQRAEAA